MTHLKAPQCQNLGQENVRKKYSSPVCFLLAWRSFFTLINIQKCNIPSSPTVWSSAVYCTNLFLLCFITFNNSVWKKIWGGYKNVRGGGRVLPGQKVQISYMLLKDVSRLLPGDFLLVCCLLILMMCSLKIDQVAQPNLVKYTYRRVQNYGPC